MSKVMVGLTKFEADALARLLYMELSAGNLADSNGGGEGEWYSRREFSAIERVCDKLREAQEAAA